MNGYKLDLVVKFLEVNTWMWGENTKAWRAGLEISQGMQRRPCFFRGGGSLEWIAEWKQPSQE